MTLEPANRALDVFVTRVLADRGEATQHGPRAVDVVHAPAAVPWPVVPLRMAEEIDRPLSGLEVLPIAERAEQLEPAPRQVLRRRIEERAVVGEGDVVQVEAVVVGVERGPAPVSVLHAEEPAEPPLLGRPRRVAAEPVHLLERHHDHRRVVEVRVEVVAVLERPAPGLHVRPLHLPVTRHEDLTLDHPLGGATQRRMIRLQVALDQRVDREGGVPDG